MPESLLREINKIPPKMLVKAGHAAGAARRDVHTTCRSAWPTRPA
jgi:hypothetical protein